MFASAPVAPQVFRKPPTPDQAKNVEVAHDNLVKGIAAYGTNFAKGSPYLRKAGELVGDGKFSHLTGWDKGKAEADKRIATDAVEALKLTHFQKYSTAYKNTSSVAALVPPAVALLLASPLGAIALAGTLGAHVAAASLGAGNRRITLGLSLALLAVSVGLLFVAGAFLVPTVALAILGLAVVTGICCGLYSKSRFHAKSPEVKDYKAKLADCKQAEADCKKATNVAKRYDSKKELEKLEAAYEKALGDSVNGEFVPEPETAPPAAGPANEEQKEENKAA